MSPRPEAAATGSGSGTVDRFAPYLALLAFCAYAAALAGDFVYDDFHSVRDNPALHDLGQFGRLWWDVDAFSALDNRMYRPVLLVSLALTSAVAGMHAWAFKLGNVLLHVAIAVALYGVARRLSVSRRMARIAVALFAVHPIAVEAINMVSARSELLLALGCVLALRARLALRRPASRGRWLAAWAGIAGATVLACGSKETGVVVPGILAAYEFARLARRRRLTRLDAVGAALVRVAPAILVALGYLWLRAELFGHATLPMRTWSGGGNPFDGHGRDLATQLATMTYLVPLSLLQIMAPLWLTLDPWVPFTDDWADPAVWAGALLVLGLIALGIWRPGRRARFVGVAIAVGTAAPWVLIPLNVPLCEHRLYNPWIGLTLVLASWSRLQSVGVLDPVDARGRQRWLPRSVQALVAVFVVLSAVRSFEYRDERQLWRRALALNPHSVRAHGGLGDCAARRGDRRATLHYASRAVALYPEHVPARRNVAEMNLQLENGDPWMALTMAEFLVDRWPDNPFYLLLKSRALGAIAERIGDDATFDRAVATALRCLEVAPPKGLVYRTAASFRRRQSRLDAALALLDTSIARGLDHQSVRLDRAEVLLLAGQRAAASQALWAIANRDPFDPRVQQLLARLRGLPRDAAANPPR